MVSREPQDKPKPSLNRRRPAATPEARERQLVSLAVDLAEEQLAAGTASAQVITHYLKLGSSREQLEQLRIQKETELIDLKREAIESQKRVEELYSKALNAMRSYAGQDPSDMEIDYEG